MGMMHAVVGEYYACFEPRISRWVAWQLLEVNRRGAVLVALDWLGAQAPEAPELNDSGLLGGAYRSYGPPPPGTIRVGSGPLKSSADTRLAENWGTRMQVRAHRERQGQIVSSTSEDMEMVALVGAVFTHPMPGHAIGGPVLVPSTLHDFVARCAQYGERFDVSQFAGLTGVRTLDLVGVPEPVQAEAVQEIARSCLGLIRLTLPPVAAGDDVLDLRDGRFSELVLHPSGLTTVLLPETIEKVVLLPGSGSTTELRFETPQDGAELELVITGELPKITGVPQLRLLHVDEIDSLDIAAVVRDFPGLRAMQLWGRPGCLRNAQALSQLTGLHTLWMQDLFGWVAAEWPGHEPAAMPSLRALLLKSAPADVVQAGKRLLRGRDSAWMEIGSPRSPEWLAENIDNPLRHWADEPRIRKAEAKRATALYVDCLRRARSIGEARDADTAAGHEDPVLELSRDFVDGINAINAKRGFMDTADREDAGSALEKLWEAAGATPEEMERAMLLADALGDD